MIDRTIIPPVALFPKLQLTDQEVVELDNGVSLHLINKGKFPLLRISLLRQGGCFDFNQPAAVPVLSSSIIEASKSKSSDTVNSLIDFWGTKITGNSSDHFTAIEALSIRKNLNDVLSLIYDFISNAEFPAHVIDINRQRLSAQCALQQYKVSYIASIRLKELLQGRDHPLSKIIKPDDYLNVERKSVLEIYEKIRTAKTHVFLAGCLDENIIDDAVNIFTKLEHCTAGLTEIIPYSPLPPNREHIDVPNSKQSAIAMGLPTIDRSHPDYILLRYAIMALGGYFGSRLMTRIREERGLTYGITSNLLGTHEGANLVISAQCDSRYIDDVINETIIEINRMISDPPKGEELMRMRHTVWSQLAQQVDTPFATLDYYSNHLKVGTPIDYLNQQFEVLKNITPDSISNVIKKHIDVNKFSIISAG